MIDAERKIEGLDELLHLATYVICSTRFPQAGYLLLKLHSDVSCVAHFDWDFMVLFFILISWQVLVYYEQEPCYSLSLSLWFRVSPKYF